MTRIIRTIRRIVLSRTTIAVIHRFVAGCLGAAALLTGASITAPAMLGKEKLPAPPALGGTALGALSGILAAMRCQPGGEEGAAAVVRGSGGAACCHKRIGMSPAPVVRSSR